MAKLYSDQLIVTKDPAGVVVEVPVDELWIVRQITTYWLTGSGLVLWALQRSSDDFPHWYEEVNAGVQPLFTHADDLRLVLLSGTSYTVLNPNAARISIHGYKLSLP